MLSDILSRLFLTAICLAPLVMFLAGMFHSRYSPVQYIFWSLARVLTRLQWGARSFGKFPLPDDRGGVIVCNHRSSVDPFFLQTVLHRKAHWMVAKEYVEHIAFSWFLKTCEVIPVNRRGIDTASTKLAIRLAEAGDLIGMLPEGRINRTEEFMLPVRPGAALIALKARVPIVPCYIEGSPFAGAVWSPFFMTARVVVHFGQPLELTEYFPREHEEGIAEEIILRAIREIARLAQRPDFEPLLAGRKWNPSAAGSDEDDEKEPSSPTRP
jgi:1-acyl-sn-glycerol-3-phosphate acyltransferase